MKPTSVLFNLLCVVTQIFSARILGIVPLPSYSHQIVFRPLWKELSLRGHQVTVMTTDPMKDPSLQNLTEIDFHSSYATYTNLINMNEMANMNFIEVMNTAIRAGSEVMEEQFQHPQVQNLLKNNVEKYDLVMMESIFPAMAAFAEKFNCPLIQILSFDAPSYIYHLVGNPSHPILNPDLLTTTSKTPKFTERLSNTFIQLFLNYYYFPKLFNEYHMIVKRHFGENYPYLEDTLRNSSALFVNTDTIFHPIRPLLPNVVQIGGGTHLSPPKPLPKDLKKLLDNAKNGFIYFSLGSNVKSSFLTEKVRNSILETFAELPYTILWKFEELLLPGKPENVIVSKWFPQQDIFRHPHIKLFITQGGLQSTEEAIYNHIPIIGIPFAGDQKTNIQSVVNKDMGLSLDIHNFEKETFKKYILEVINNPRYRNKVKELAELAKDQPISGLDRAIWWAEHVIRHKGAKHLRNPAIDLPDYQYFLLDVIGFCVVVLLLVSLIVYKLLKYLYNLLKRFLFKNKLKVQ